MNLGLVSPRALPRVNPLKGWENEYNLVDKESAPVKDGVTIKSGQLISLDNNGEWVLGAATGVKPYIAQQDSTDGDVTSSGLLTGLPCSSKLVIEIGYVEDADFATGDKGTNVGNYTRGTTVVADAANPGSVIALPAAAGTYDVVGIVSRRDGYGDSFENATDKKVLAVELLWTGRSITVV